ncbi:MAG: MFS transporter [Oscillospiraceae bacterium]|nr:MFS transporter [Oscillospiraceae bacterium]
MRHNEKFKSQIIFASAFLMWFSIYSYQSNFTPYMQSLAFSPTTIGLIIGSYGLTQMLLRVPLGVLSDKLGTRKLFIIIGVAFTFLSALFLFFSENVLVVLFARAGAGVAASTWVSFMVLNSSYHDREKTVKAVGTLDFFSGTGQIGGIIAGSLLVGFTAQKDKSAFLLAFLVGLSSFVLSFMIYEDKEKLKQNKSPGVAQDRPKISKILSNKTLIIVSVIGVVSQLITFGTIFGFTPAYAKEVLKIDDFQNGILMVFSYLPTAFGALFLGRFLTGKVREYKLVFIGMLTLGAATILIPFVKLYPLLLISQTAAGVGKGISFPLLMGLSIKKIPENARGTAMGIFQAAYGFGMFLGPFAVGAIKEHFELGAAFILIGSICFLCSLIAYYSLKKLDL